MRYKNKAEYHVSYCNKLRSELELLESTVRQLLDTVRIIPYDPNANNRSFYVVVSPIHSVWRDGDDPALTKKLQRDSIILQSKVRSGFAGLMANDAQKVKGELTSREFSYHYQD